MPTQKTPPSQVDKELHKEEEEEEGEEEEVEDQEQQETHMTPRQDAEVGANFSTLKA